MSSLINVISPKIRRKIIKPDLISWEVFRELDLSPEAKKVLRRILFNLLLKIVMWSPKLFTIKPEMKHYEEYLKYYVMDRETRQREILGTEKLVEGNDEEILALEIPRLPPLDLTKNTSHYKKTDCSSDSDVDEDNVTPVEYEVKTVDNIEEESIEEFAPASKKVKLSNENEESIEFIRYFHWLCNKYLVGELKLHAFWEVYAFYVPSKEFIKENNIEKLNSLCHFNRAKLQEHILTFFDYHPENCFPESHRCPELFFCCAIGFVEYFAAELCELGGNVSMSWAHPNILYSHLMAGVKLDAELTQVMSQYYYLNDVCLDLLLGGDVNDIPEINQTGKGTFSEIIVDVHGVILKQFDNISELLSMRLVCKHWNHLILNDSDIWKYLTFHASVACPELETIDSTFSITEMENKFQHLVELDNNFCTNYYLKVLKDRLQQNNWFDIYFMVFKHHDRVPQMLQRHAIPFGITENLLKQNLFTQAVATQTKPLEGSTKLDQTIDVPKGMEYLFPKFDNGFVMIVGQINCGEATPFLNSRYFPSKGLLYFLVDHSSGDPKACVRYIENPGNQLSTYKDRSGSDHIFRYENVFEYLHHTFSDKPQVGNPVSSGQGLEEVTLCSVVMDTFRAEFKINKDNLKQRKFDKVELDFAFMSNGKDDEE